MNDPQNDSPQAGLLGISQANPQTNDHSPQSTATSLNAAGSKVAGQLSSATGPAATGPAATGGPHAMLHLAEQPTGSQPVSRPRLSVQLRAIGVTKSYWKGPHQVPVLQGIDLEVDRGEFVAVTGQSGCGKTTLLHLLGTLDRPDGGKIELDGRRIDHLPSGRRDRLRNQTFGMIFQFYHLLPELTTLENVLTPAMIRHGGLLSYWRHRGPHLRRATELLEMVGLGHRLKHKPRELSGGEMQRAAIARALVSEPQVLLADEPTGNLDPAIGQDILTLLRRLNKEQDLTIVMVTHDLTIARQADRQVRLIGGRIHQ